MVILVTGLPTHGHHIVLITNPGQTRTILAVSKSQDKQIPDFNIQTKVNRSLGFLC